MALIHESPVSTLRIAGAPGAGTDEVQTLTFGGTPTGGTFKLSFKGSVTAPIEWSATNNTLIANIDAALGALAQVGASNVTTAVGTMTAGIGTITVTFVGTLAKAAQPLIKVADNSLTGTAPTLAVTETTPGVSASGRGASKGVLLVDTDTGDLYVNLGTESAPTWTKIAEEITP